LDFLANVGPGLFFEVNDLLLLRTDLRYMVNVGTERLGERRDIFSDLEWTVGLTLRFGGEKPPQVRDSDGDGFLDAEDDQCLDAPGNWRGCPDKNEDSYLDDDDACPEEWGPADADGCPQKVQVTAAAIVILEKVYFDVDQATIKEKSYDILNEVRQVMLTVDRIKMIEVAGHTDADGAEEDNLILSQAWAEAVVQYLVDKGIERERLDPIGYSEGAPIESNNSSAGKAKNRRVEFNITEQEGDTGVETE
jgi:OmpA-OmpF porin, OOP family